MIQSFSFPDIVRIFIGIHILRKTHSPSTRAIRSVYVLIDLQLTIQCHMTISGQ